MMASRCQVCGHDITRERCPSCELYNAAVRAQAAAAVSLARSHGLDTNGAYLNEHGVFAWSLDRERLLQIGTAEEAAPFAALTTEARRVRKFQAIDLRTKSGTKRVAGTKER